jgi:hypothetical protein
MVTPHGQGRCGKRVCEVCRPSAGRVGPLPHISAPSPTYVRILDVDGSSGLQLSVTQPGSVAPDPQRGEPLSALPDPRSGRPANRRPDLPSITGTTRPSIQHGPSRAPSPIPARRRHGRASPCRPCPPPPPLPVRHVRRRRSGPAPVGRRTRVPQLPVTPPSTPLATPLRTPLGERPRHPHLRNEAPACALALSSPSPAPSPPSR